MPSLKKLVEEAKQKGSRSSQLTMQAPVPVVIKEWFKEENRVTVQLSASDYPGLDRTSVGDTKFPILAPEDGTAMMDIQVGAPAMLFYPGWQIKRGWVVLGHTEGNKLATTYTPIRWSWAV